MPIRPAKKTALILLLALLLVVGFAVPTSAQEDVQESPDVQLFSPYLGVSVEPGDSTTLDLELNGPPGEIVDLEVTQLPDDWTAQIRGGGFVVDQVLMGGTLDPNLELQVDVPQNASEGAYQVAVAARGASSNAELTFQLMVAEAVGGGVWLNAEFPALRGPSDVQFSFTLELDNQTAEEIQFGLQAQGPAGWQVTARPAGESRASSVAVAAASSERLTVEADPPDTAEAGVYPVVVQAAGGGETASTELAVEITGNFALTLTTPDERLNLDVQAGAETEFPLIVVNSGTAALTDLSLSATPPSGWDVSFTPSSIDRIAPGGSAEVTALITPASDAINGDYRITMRAQVPETSDSVELRTTVETSAWWGLVGVAVIVIALGALVTVFRRFGRR